MFISSNFSVFSFETRKRFIAILLISTILVNFVRANEEIFSKPSKTYVEAEEAIFSMAQIDSVLDLPYDEACLTNLDTADEDSDGKLNPDETIGFIQLQSECPDGTITEIPQQQKPFFVGFACLCLGQPGASFSCCAGDNAMISIPEKDQQLSVICNIKYLDRSFYCGEIPPELEITPVPSPDETIPPSDQNSDNGSDTSTKQLVTGKPGGEDSDAPSDAPSDSPSDLSSGIETDVPTEAINCTMIDDGKTKFNVCFRANFTGSSSIGMLPNGSATPAFESYTYSYRVYDEENEPIIDIMMDRSGEVLDAGNGEDLTKCNGLFVEGIKCDSCTYCGNEKFSADCTNLVFGRDVDCESSIPLFFPMTAEALTAKNIATISVGLNLTTVSPSDDGSAGNSEDNSDFPSNQLSSSPSDARCSSYAVCRNANLTGVCCPTVDDKFLDCCFGISDAPSNPESMVPTLEDDKEGAGTNTDDYYEYYDEETDTPTRAPTRSRNNNNNNNNNNNDQQTDTSTEDDKNDEGGNGNQDKEENGDEKENNRIRRVSVTSTTTTTYNGRLLRQK